MSHAIIKSPPKPTSRAWLADLRATPQSVVGVHRDADLSVVIVDLREERDDAITRWIVDAGTQLFTELQALIVRSPPEQDPRVCVVVVDPATDGPLQPAHDAACAMVRGAVLSLGPERPEARLTMVRARPTQLDELEATLDFLASEGASYITAATLDLTQGT